MMKRAYRVKICTALFLLCTAVKMLSPSAAALLRQTVLPVLDRNDDYRAALYRVESEPRAHLWLYRAGGVFARAVRSQ